MQLLAGVGGPPSYAQWGLRLPTIDPSFGLRLQVRDFPGGAWSPKVKDTCLGRALPGLDLRRSELQAHLCPFLAM